MMINEQRIPISCPNMVSECRVEHRIFIYDTTFVFSEKYCEKWYAESRVRNFKRAINNSYLPPKIWGKEFNRVVLDSVFDGRLKRYNELRIHLKPR